MGGLAVSWSGGKDAAWTVHRLRAEGRPVEVLITTVTAGLDRVSVHGIRRGLVLQQADQLQLPLIEIELPAPCSDGAYAAAWSAALSGLRDSGRVSAVAFGDLHLGDVRRWREQLLQSLGMTAEFPLWSTATDRLAQSMLAAGLRARIVCLDPAIIDRSWLGRPWGQELLDALPASADPCGERGEFHTFVTAGPMFESTIEVDTGAVTERDGIAMIDLIGRDDPAGPTASPCRQVCRVGRDGICDGCGRSLSEITDWLTMPETRRRVVADRVRGWRVRGYDPSSGQTQPRNS